MQLLDLLDHFNDFQSSTGEKSPGNVVLYTLASLASSEGLNELEFVRRLPQLVRMRNARNSLLLDLVIASVVESSLPIYLEGLPVPSIQGNFAGLLTRSGSRWRGHLSSKSWKDIDVEQFLSQDMSEPTIRIVIGLLYRQPSVRFAVLRWIPMINPIMDMTRFLPLIHALFDVSSSIETNTLESEEAHWTSFLPRLTAIITDQNALPLLRSRSKYCLMKILLTSKAERSFLGIVAMEVRLSLRGKPTTELLALAIWLERQFGSDANEVVSEVLDAGLLSSIDSIADKECSDEFLQLLSMSFLVVAVSVVQGSFSITSRIRLSSQATFGRTCVISDNPASSFGSCCTTIGYFVSLKL